MKNPIAFLQVDSCKDCIYASKESISIERLDKYYGEGWNQKKDHYYCLRYPPVPVIRKFPEGEKATIQMRRPVVTSPCGEYVDVSEISQMIQDET